MLLTTGMIDLSIGSMLALGARWSRRLLHARDAGAGWPLVATIARRRLLGGGLNGVLVTKAGLSFFVVTLGTLAIFRSAAQVPTDGHQHPTVGQARLRVGRAGSAMAEWDLVSVPVVLSLLVAVAGRVRAPLDQLRARQVYAVGGNEGAARLAGIPVERVRIAVFAINGLLVGLAAIVFVGRIQVGSPLIGAGIELEVIAAVLLGGTSFLGGAEQPHRAHARRAVHRACSRTGST